MFSPYLVASFVLVGLSAARPQSNVTPDTACTSSTAPTGTVASFDGEITSPAQLSKRHHHHHHHHHDDDEGGDWDNIASKGIDEVGDVIKSIIGIWGPHDDDDTESITTTVTQNPGTTTITQNPGTTTITGIPGTITVTANPGTTTITTNTDKTTSPPTTSTITVTGTVTITRPTLTSTSTQPTYEPECTTCGCEQSVAGCVEWQGLPW